MDVSEMINEYKTELKKPNASISRLSELEMEIGWFLEEEPMMVVGERNERGIKWVEIMKLIDGTLGLCLYTNIKEITPGKKSCLVFHHEVIKIMQNEKMISKLVINPNGVNVELDRDCYSGDRVIGKIKER